MTHIYNRRLLSTPFCSMRNVIEGLHPTNHAFSVLRTANGELPVYKVYKNNGKIVNTVVKHVRGDLNECRKTLAEVCESPVKLHMGSVEIRGIHTWKIKEYLESIGLYAMILGLGLIRGVFSTPMPNLFSGQVRQFAVCQPGQYGSRKERMRRMGDTLNPSLWKWYHRHGYWATRRKNLSFMKKKTWRYHEVVGLGKTHPNYVARFDKDPSSYRPFKNYWYKSRIFRNFSLMNGEFQGNTLGPTTRKELREVAGGNITIEDILNRAKFDDSFPIRRFSVLVEHSNRQPLCYFFTWENGVCKYGNRCRYLHDSQIQLRTLDDRPVCQKSTMPNLSRSSLSDIIQGEVGDGQLLHGIAFIEYQGRIVWNRDGGKNSRTLWEKCLLRIASKRTQLRAIASSVGAESVQSAPESVKLIELLREENFNSLFNFLAIDDMYNMLIAFASCSYIRNESRTCMLSNTVWDSAISKKWELPYTHHDNPIQAFMSLEHSSKEAHAFLSSSTNGLFTHGNSAPDPNPCSGVPALADLENTLVGKTILISDDGVPIVDIRFTNSLIATANGSEISLVRRGDLVKVSTSTGKQKNSADKLALVPSVSGNNWLVHAGTSDLFLRDVDEPGLKLVKKISPPSDYPFLLCCSLDATSQAAYVGYTDFGMGKVDIETGIFGSLLRVDGLVSSRQWSSDGRLHLFSSSNDSLAFWDLRMKDRIPLVHEPSSPCVFSFSEFASPLVVVGCSNKLSGVDIRTGKFLWSIPTHSPVTHLSVSRNIVSTFTGTISNPLTEISVHDLTRDASLPTRIGEHQIPFRVSAVGYPCDSSTSAGGCVFAVKSRPKRSGRGGDDGILCVGGSGFMNPPPVTTKRISSAGSTPRLAPTTPPIHNRRSSRDHQRVVHFLV